MDIEDDKHGCIRRINVFIQHKMDQFNHKHFDDDCAKILKDVTAGYLIKLMNSTYSKHKQDSKWRIVTKKSKDKLQHRIPPPSNSAEVEADEDKLQKDRQPK